MIASDGSAFERVDVESFNIFAGERYDFVLNASKPVGNYWVRVRGLADCEVKQAKQVTKHINANTEYFNVKKNQNKRKQIK